MELKPSQLRYFVNVAATRSYKDAARTSFRSQPAISLAIKTLEDQLGARLFESGKRVALTRLGERILPIAQEFLAHHDRLARTLDQVAKGEMGELSIAANPAVASHWLPNIIRAYTEKFPGVLVYATDHNSETVLDLVATGRVDIGIASITGFGDDVQTTPILADSFGVVSRADHPLIRRAGPLRWSHLQGYPIIGNMTHHLLIGTSVASYVAEPKIFMSTLTSLLANVEAGIGITVLPQTAVPAHNPELAFRPLHAPKLQRTIGLVMRRGRVPSPQMVAMADIIAHAASRLGAHALPVHKRTARR